MNRRYIVLSLIGLAVLTAIGWNVLTGAGAQQDPPRLYEDIPLDATLIRMDKRALEEAYHEQLVRLFGVWLKQGAPADAQAFRNGLRIARRAYNQTAQEIAKREQELLELDKRQQDERK